MYSPTFDDSDKNQMLRNLSSYKTEAENFLLLKNKKLTIKKIENYKNEKKIKKFEINFDIKTNKNYKNFENDKISNRNKEPLLNEKGQKVDADTLVAEMSLNACENLFNIYSELEYDVEEDFAVFNTSSVKLNINSNHDYYSEDKWHDILSDKTGFIDHLSNYNKLTAIMQEINVVEDSRFLLMNNNVFYWKIKDYYYGMPENLLIEVEENLNPMWFLGKDQLLHTSVSVFRELNLYFDLFINNYSDGKILLDKMFYLGSNVSEFKKFTKSLEPSKVITQSVKCDSTWEQRNKSKIFDEEYNYLQRFEENMMNMFALEVTGDLNVVLLDWDCQSTVRTMSEQERCYDMFKQFVIFAKYSTKGTKLVMKIPSLYYSISRELLTMFSSLFERVQIVKPSTCSLMSEVSYICFENKICDGFGQLEQFFTLNELYFDTVHKRNLKLGRQKFLMKNVLLMTTEYLMNETYIYLTKHKLELLRYMFCSYKIIFNFLYRNTRYDLNPFTEDILDNENYINFYYHIMLGKLKIKDDLEEICIQNESIIIPELTSDVCLEYATQFDNIKNFHGNFSELEDILGTMVKSKSSLNKSDMFDISLRGLRISEILLLYNSWYSTKKNISFKYHESNACIDDVESRLRMTLIHDNFYDIPILNVQDDVNELCQKLDLVKANVRNAKFCYKNSIGFELLPQIEEKDSYQFYWNKKDFGRYVKNKFEPMEQKLIFLLEDFQYYFNSGYWDTIQTNAVYESQNIIVGTYIDDESKLLDKWSNYINNGKLYLNETYSKSRKKYFMKIKDDDVITNCLLSNVDYLICDYTSLNEIFDLQIEHSMRKMFSEKKFVVIYPREYRFEERINRFIGTGKFKYNYEIINWNDIHFNNYVDLTEMEWVRFLKEDYGKVLITIVENVTNEYLCFLTISNLIRILKVNKLEGVLEYAKCLLLYVDRMDNNKFVDFDDIMTKQEILSIIEEYTPETSDGCEDPLDYEDEFYDSEDDEPIIVVYRNESSDNLLLDL